jgi:hypothetical protein
VDRTVAPGQEVFINVTPDEYEIRGGRPSEGVVGMIQNLLGFGTNSNNSSDITVTGSGCTALDNGGCSLILNPGENEDISLSSSANAQQTRNIAVGLELSNSPASGYVVDYKLCAWRFSPPSDKLGII